jgi:uncharacterized damage-inducible protein DinB
MDLFSMKISVMSITRPLAAEYAPYFERYITLVKGNDLVAALRDGQKNLREFVLSIPVNKLDYRYADGKWNIREILVHIIDCERVFAYRALTCARHDETPLPGFDEEIWGRAMNAHNRPIDAIMQEFDAVRNATIALFTSFNNGEDQYLGNVNNNKASARALGYIICGHEIHHMRVIQEKYLAH